MLIQNILGYLLVAIYDFGAPTSTEGELVCASVVLQLRVGGEAREDAQLRRAVVRGTTVGLSHQYMYV